jgi:lipopolysaccharide/colanic/teichoic acid biosynthesis glycosyltransferase
MIKFRSMKVGADLLHAQLKEQKRESLVNSNMFKDPEDPRVTRVGRFIRRYSIDELPQIFNVLKGDMSLVGPRPPLPSEVEEYEEHAHRRLLVKPGITGIWQVSGRSSLSWEETVRLDLDYVENWSIAGDLIILAKTVSVVFGAKGAY